MRTIGMLGGMSWESTALYYRVANEQVRERLADNIQSIISLRLLPDQRGTGRVPAVEVMRTTRSIRECIRDMNRAVEIRDHIERGQSDMQMQTFDQHLLQLYQANKIRLEIARAAASNPRDFATKLALEGDSSIAEQEPVEIGDENRF